MYMDRPDCIYKRMSDGTAHLKERARYHTEADERARDVGMKFEKANVLLSTDFRYFGKAGTDDYKEEYPDIRAAIERLTQGHRVNHKENLYRELIELKMEVWRNPTKIQGKPTSSDQSKVCNSGPTLEVC
jgi:hypothetical protein